MFQVDKVVRFALVGCCQDTVSTRVGEREREILTAREGCRVKDLVEGVEGFCRKERREVDEDVKN